MGACLRRRTQPTQPDAFHGLGEPPSITALRTLRSPTAHSEAPYSQPASPVPPAHLVHQHQEAAAPHPGSAAAEAPLAAATQARPSTVGALPSVTSHKLRPWLMPWQTGDRVAGRHMANLVKSKRTPTGAFANLDLAKAAK